ncbi:MAG TPA: hypothetical protein VI942_11060 [Thermoanaerobaculia bacterium]|nr:hypothetical protein [Thermoanaerobaculia bacterium]
MSRVSRVAAVLLFAVALAGVAAAVPDQTLSYQGWLVDPFSRLPRAGSLAVTIRIDRLTSDDDAKRLADLVSARGPRALGPALEELEVGRLSIGDRYMMPISYARRVRHNDGEHLILIAQRAISFREIFRSSRSKDYPYTAIELDLDETGRGSGELIAAARFLPRQDGTVDIDTLQFIAARLMSVRQVEAER